MTSTRSWATVESEHPPALHTQFAPVASVGTSTDLTIATRVLLSNFALASDGGAAGEKSTRGIDVTSLSHISADRDGRFPVGLRVAARFFLSSSVDRFFVSFASGRQQPDGVMTSAGLDATLSILSAGQFESKLQDMIDQYGRRSGIQSEVLDAALLRDPGVPIDVRNNVVRRLSDAQVLRIIGRPDVEGSARDTADETRAFIALARASWLGAAEAQALVRYKVPFRMDRGTADKGFSFWDGQAMHLSEKMTTSGAPGYLSEVLAHEGGHAIFQESGLRDKTYRDADAARLTPGVANIINEGFAGVFGNRAHVALFGHNDRNADRHLIMLNDVSDSLASNSTFYANYYHVDTAAARAQINDIKRLMSKDLVPFLQRNFNLLGDPQLSVGLAPSTY
jgi:hypothetical protein